MRLCGGGFAPPMQEVICGGMSCIDVIVWLLVFVQAIALFRL